MKYIDQLTLSFGHSMLMGNKPEKLELGDMTEKGLFDRKSVESFGLFDGSSPNYTTYYPDLNLEDLTPKDEEFIYPVYRLLSAVTLPTYRGPLSFEKPGVLKGSVPLIIGQTVNIDHEMMTGNAVGAVVEASWQNSYTLPNGLKVPAGINGTFKIDGKANPRIARGIMMNPPSIHSNSVTVNFVWEKSHPKMGDEEFESKLGTNGPDGKMVKMVVSEILYYMETSLVPHGRDPYAKKLDDNGKIIPQNVAKQHASRLGDIQNSMMSWKSSRELFEQESFSLNTNQNQNNKMEELIRLMAENGITVTEENAVETLRELQEHFKTSSEEIESLKESLQAKEVEMTTQNLAISEKDEKIESLSTELQSYKDMEQGNLQTTRAEAEKFYKLVKGEKADDKIISAINESSPELSLSFLKTYKEEFEALTPLVCGDCHSHNVSRASAIPPDTEENTTQKPLTRTELKAKIQRENNMGLKILK